MNKEQSVGKKGPEPARWDIAVGIEALVWEQSLGLLLTGGIKMSKSLTTGALVCSTVR